ncbi:MAG: DMT family transporter [Verrucomicrobia bacterium]|nr:DMT family transporter [Verrucomicrobiota bacterium]
MRSSFRVIKGGSAEEDLSSIASAADEVQLRRTKEELEGWIFTSMGVLCFSLSFVSTRLALRGFDPLFIALARGAGAGTITLVCVLLGKYPMPAGKQVLRLCLAAAGIVFAFPIFTTIALQSVPASHAATVSAILPLLTAVFGVWRKRERVPILFWAIAAAGTAVVGWYLISRAGGIQLRQADLLIIVACVACSYGYAEGGLLAQEMGGWRAICWMLVFSAPVALILFVFYLIGRGPLHPVDSPSAWFGLVYQMLVSQFIGFAFYYRGLAQGGVARMSQIQQFQSVLAVLAAGLILGEQIDVQLWAVLGLLLGAVVGVRWALRKKRIADSQ